MFGKLARGEYPLCVSFWKFGVFGLILSWVVLYVLEKLLYANLGGMSLYTYYFKHLGFLNANPKVLILTGLHFVSLVLYAVYSFMVFLGVWRSSAAYEKSVWLSGMARICIIILTIVGINYAF